MKYWIPIVAATALTLSLGGCVSTGIKNSSGARLEFSQLYSPTEMDGGKFVLIGLNRITKEYTIDGLLTERPKSIKPNQELLAFNKMLTKYAIALDNLDGLKYHRNTIPGTIMEGDSEPYFICTGGKPSKSDGYTACSSDLYTRFLPYEAIVAHAKGQMPQYAFDNWKARTANWVKADNPGPLITKLNIVGALEGGSPANKP